MYICRSVVVRYKRELVITEDISTEFDFMYKWTSNRSNENDFFKLYSTNYTDSISKQ